LTLGSPLDEARMRTFPNEMATRRADTAVDDDVRVAVGSARAWSTAGGTRATGYAFQGEKLLRAEQLAAVVAATPPHALPTLLDGLTGSFAAIKDAPDAVYAIVDQVRAIPLFCVDEAGGQVVTDDPLETIPGVLDRECDWRKRAELLKCLCVTGTDTLLDGVRQVEAGSLLRVPRACGGTAESRPWYAFRPNLEPDTSENLLETAYETHRAAVERTIRFADNALIVVPLSAGRDSGILATLLARSGIDREQVLTYTFGRPNNRESEVSRRVARALGLRWEFVPYSDAMWAELAREPWWPGYLTWASSFAGVPGFADLPAMFELRQRGLVPDGSVVVPGHSLDFPSGSHIPGRLVRRRRGTRADVVDAVLTAYYKYRSDDVIAAMLGRSAAEIAAAVRERAELSVPATSASMTREQLVSATDEWGWKERQAKLIVNSVRVYEHQDLRWALPWWDREVLDFWARVPLRQRVATPLRCELAAAAGWPTKAPSLLDSLQSRLERQARVLALDGPAKKVRNLARRVTKRSRYHHDELACLGLFGEQRYLRSFHGTETPRAMLAEDLLESLDAPGEPPL
jgi:asparagine synthase (glutamine-hydrolysing)